MVFRNISLQLAGIPVLNINRPKIRNSCKTTFQNRLCSAQLPARKIIRVGNHTELILAVLKFRTALTHPSKRSCLCPAGFLPVCLFADFSLYSRFIITIFARAISKTRPWPLCTILRRSTMIEIEVRGSQTLSVCTTNWLSRGNYFNPHLRHPPKEPTLGERVSNRDNARLRGVGSCANYVVIADQRNVSYC